MKTLKDIDYSPLEAMRLPWHKAIHSVFGLSALVVVVLAVAMIGLSVYHLSIFAFFLLSGFVGVAASRVYTHKNMAWKKFADANGWHIVPITANDPRFIPPGIMSPTRDLKVSMVVHAQFEGHECDIYLHEYSVTRGKKESFYYTVARVILERPFPHIIVDSKQTWALSNRNGATQKVSLEGDFDKYFSVYHDPGDHINALSIITPDVMQALIKMNKAYDIEIIGNQLFFMVAQDHRGPEELPDLLAAVDALADEIAHKAKTIRLPEGHVPHMDILTTAIKQYGQSKEAVLNELIMVFVFMLSLPFLIFLFAGMVGWATNLLN